jgi:glucokinase
VLSEGGGYRVLPSEAGHAALGAGNALELEILRRLQDQFEHVDNERILSGTGLVRLYAALCMQQGQAPRWHTPAEVIAAADAGDDPLATQCLEVFCAWLGSLAGDLAITFCAGTVYLAGGITGHIGQHLSRGGFLRRFLDKGVLAPALQQVPVFRIEHGWLGIVGAAAWYRARHTGTTFRAR